jgi:hypothetical protein
MLPAILLDPRQKRSLPEVGERGEGVDSTVRGIGHEISAGQLIWNMRKWSASSLTWSCPSIIGFTAD